MCSGLKASQVKLVANKIENFMLANKIVNINSHLVIKFKNKLILKTFFSFLHRFHFENLNLLRKINSKMEL